MTTTYVDSIDTVALLVQVGDGDDPEVFAHPCLINTNRSFSRKANTNAQEVARCDDPTAPMKTIRSTTSTDSDISGEGTLPAASAKAMYDMVGQTKNIKVQAGSSTGALVVTGPYILEEFTITGSKKGDLVTATVKWSQADEPTSTAHA